ncbi:MAG: polysaccharide deacetylase family protein [Candidatus Omnitrophica bacterium]|nr:polysaccharide deacetylase family protein [Candidatus Omnitrophota bacterium]
MVRIKRIIIALLVIVLLIGGGIFWLKTNYVVPVLMYHFVVDSDHYVPNFVSPKNFEKQMAYLARHKFYVMRFDELIQRVNHHQGFPPKSVVITFDDGYVDNYTNAFSVLKKYHFPAIIFMPSDHIGLQGRLSLLQLQEMIASGIDVGSHGRNHLYLPTLSLEKAKDEVFNSKRILEQRLGSPVDYFAYPQGGFNEQIITFVKQAGYKGACTTNRGNNRLNKDIFELKRIRLSDHDNSDFILWLKLSGYYNSLRKNKNSD